MPIPVRCPDCGVRSQYADRFAGQMVACKACGSDVEVPRGGKGSAAGSAKKSRKKKASSNSGPLLIVAALGGFAVLGIAAAVGIYLVMNRPQPIAAQPAEVPIAGNSSPVPGASGSGTPSGFVPAATPRNTSTAKAPVSTPTPSGFQSNTTEPEEVTRLAFSQPSPWTAKADAPSSQTVLTLDKPLKLKLDSNNLRNPALVFPATASDLVAIRSGTGGKDPVELYRLSSGQKAGQVPMQSYASMIALSPGGKYLAYSTLGAKTISVYDIQGKKLLGELATADASATFRPSTLLLPRDDLLVAISQLEREIKTWELPSGKFLRSIPGSGPNARPHDMFAISPNGSYLAVNAEFLKKTIEIYDLRSGELAATIAIDGQTSSIELTGMGFSANGAEFAILYDITRLGNRQDFSQFVVWDLETGKISSDFDIEPRIKEQLDPAYQSERLESFPNGRRWLVHSAGIIDRDQKRLIFSYPKQDGVNLTASRRVMADDWIVSVSKDAADARLESISIDEAALTAAAKSAEAGGMAMDATLPPLTASDFTTASTAVASNRWQAFVDGREQVESLKDRVAIEAVGGAVRDIVMNGGSTPFVAARIALGEDENDPALRVYEMSAEETRRILRMRPPQPIAKTSHIDLFDAVSGERVSRYTLPFSGELIDLSPNGQQALVQLHRGEGRLDVFSLVDNPGAKLAWRPYRAAPEAKDREIDDAVFVDDQHVATLSKNGILVVWKLEGLTPLFQIDTVNRFVVSPGGKQLFALRGTTAADKDLAIFNALTGEGLGIVELEGYARSMAVHPRGEFLAISHGDAANNELTILNIADGQIAMQFPVPDVATRLQWTGDDYLLLGGSQLISRDLQAVVWNYAPGAAALPMHPRSLVCQFAAPAGNRWQLRAVNLPTDELKSKLTETEIGSLALVKPGDTLGLKVTVGDDPLLSELKRDAVRQLRERLTQAQFTIAEGDQRILVEADISLKNGETVQLSKIGNRSEQEPVVRKTMQLHVKYMMGQKTLWAVERRASNLDRMLISLKPGESAQQATDRLLTESSQQILTGLKLPSYVFGDRARTGLGSSPLISIP